MDKAKCPHCGQLLEITKAVLPKAKPIAAQNQEDLGSGILKSTVDAVDEKLNSSLAALARFGTIAKTQTKPVKDETLGGFVLKQMREQVLVKESMMQNGGLIPGKPVDAETVQGSNMAAQVMKALCFGRK